MTTARIDTNPRDGGTRNTATAVGGTTVKSRNKAKATRPRYQDAPEWIYLQHGRAKKRAFPTTAV